MTTIAFVVELGNCKQLQEMCSTIIIFTHQPLVICVLLNAALNGQNFH